MESQEFKDFVEVIFSAKCKVDGNYMEFTLCGSSVQQIDFIKNKFEEYGLSGVRCEDGVITINTKANFIDDKSIIFTSLDNLWFKSNSLKVLPEKYIVLKENISSLKVSSKITSISVYLKWTRILDAISNHKSDDKYIMYIPSEDGGKELLIDKNHRLDLVFKINTSASDEASLDAFLKVLDINDAQRKERESIIRSAIYDFLSDSDDKSINSLANVSERIYNRYNDLLELYTNRFSVNKLLSELEQKDLEYNTKINDFLSASQSKAFAIPGALIAIGGIAKASGILDSSLIMIGLYLIYHITKLSNQVLDESYESLKKSIRSSFNRYKKFEEGVEVKKTAEEMNEDLLIKVDSAQLRVKRVNKIGIYMILIGAVYLFLKWLSSENITVLSLMNSSTYKILENFVKNIFYGN